MIRLATWLLRTFGSGDQIESLLGDLTEEYREGRTPAWFWWQAISAIAVTFIIEVRAHTLLMLRAIAVGWGVSLLYAALLYALQPLLFSETPRRLLVFVIFFIAVCARWLEGTVVAALHRNHRVAAVLAFSMSYAAMALVGRVIPLLLFSGAHQPLWGLWFSMLMVNLLAIWASLLRGRGRLVG